MTAKVGSRPHLHHPFTISEIRVENRHTQTFVFQESLPAQPGQFVMAWLPGVDEKPFSIAGAEPLMLTVAAVGPFSRAMHELPVGDRVWVRGPLGQGFRIREGKMLLVGGGYGVAPLLFLAKEAMIGKRCVVETCIGAQTAEDLLLVNDFEQAGVTVHITTEDGSLGTKGIVTVALEAAIAHSRPNVVCACGPVKMLEAVDRLCAIHKLPRQLSWEAHMRCGIGLCGSCELLATTTGPERPQQANGQGSGWLVCLDGPVSFSQ